MEELGTGGEELFGEFLGFVEDDDAVGDVVEFAATGRLGGVEGLEELDVGGDDDRDVGPVFGELSKGNGDFVFLLAPFGLGVMFEDVVSVAILFIKDSREGVSGLLDDGGIGDGVDDFVLAVGDGVFEGEAKGGEGLAAAGGDGEGVEAGGVLGLGEDGVEDVVAEFVDGAIMTEGCHVRVVAVEEGGEIVELLGASGGVLGVHEALGVEPVGVDEAGEEHLDPEPELARHFFAVAVFDEIGQKIPHLFGRCFFDALWFLCITKVMGQRGVIAHAIGEAGVVTIDRVGEESAEGGNVGVEPLGAVGGVGVTGTVFA